jgi:hypothetical protein
LKPVGARNFSAYYRVLGPTQPPIQWIPRTLSLEVRRPGHEADHTPTSSAEVKECVELYLLSPNTPSWRGAHLKRSTGTTLPLPVLPFVRNYNSDINSRRRAALLTFAFKLYVCFASLKQECVTKSFRTVRLERELQMEQLSATRCSCIAIL